MTPNSSPLDDVVRQSSELYEPLRPELYRYCRHLTRSAWDAEDMAQDTLARAFVTLGCLTQAPENPRAWLFRVASNLWLNQRRRAREELGYSSQYPSPATVTHPKNNMKTTQSADGTRIAFETVGTGPALVLVGGAFCDRRARASGTPLAALLSARFTVFSYDRRGRGDSTDTAPYAIAREVEDLAALIREAGDRAFVYGISSGASLALEAAAAQLPISRLALYEAPVIVPGTREVPPEDFASELARLCSAGQRSEATELFLTRAVQVATAVVDRMKTSPIWAGLQAIAHTLRYDAELTSDAPALLARASKVRAKVLVLHGSESPPWVAESARALAARIADASERTLAGQTHDVNPAVLAEALESFFGEG